MRDWTIRGIGALVAIAIAGTALTASVARPSGTVAAKKASGCALGDGSRIKHMIYLQFDTQSRIRFPRFGRAWPDSCIRLVFVPLR
jgi:hypothetical protein